MQGRRILVVAERHTSNWFRQTLEERGFVVFTAASLEEAGGHLAAANFDLLLIDLEMVQAADFIKQARLTMNTAPVLAVGQWGSGRATVALTLGADAYEPAPITDERLVDAVERLLHKRATVVGMKK